MRTGLEEQGIPMGCRSLELEAFLEDEFLEGLPERFDLDQLVRHNSPRKPSVNNTKGYVKRRPMARELVTVGTVPHHRLTLA